MAWTAVQHLRASPLALPGDPAVIGIDRELAAAIACLLAVPGLLWPRLRPAVAVIIMMAIVYQLSTQRLAGTLGWDAIMRAPLFAAALFIWWPRLVRVRKPDA